METPQGEKRGHYYKLTNERKENLFELKKTAGARVSHLTYNKSSGNVFPSFVSPRYIGSYLFVVLLNDLLQGFRVSIHQPLVLWSDGWIDERMERPWYNLPTIRRCLNSRNIRSTQYCARNEEQIVKECHQQWVGLPDLNYVVLLQESC